MPKLREITALLNTAVQAGAFTSKRFQAAAFDAVAELITTLDDSEKESRRPVLVGLDGQCTDMVIDDTKPMQVYHRILGLEELDPDDEAFGDAGNIVREQASMRLVVLGDRERLQLHPEDIIAAIALYLPRKLTRTQLQNLLLRSCEIEPGEVNLNMQEVFDEEYVGTQYAFKPNNIAAVLNYTITTTYKKDCFYLCI